MIMQLTTELAVKEDREPGPKITKPADAAEYLKDLRLSLLQQETFICVTLDCKSQIIDRHIISIGVLDSTLVSPRELYRVAINDSAKSILVAHNHPSGDLAPSAQDLQVTKKLIEAGRIMEIALLDHLIIAAGDDHLSLKESGLVKF
ncbi:hypothetical protein PDESU_06311 [Pontiella desulfatans]|uniref:MPN domain-containing protein n=1 Tax=Pontiella desulfatans TaxID=2750659 RepID=A0A6C2UCS9_PONDE|nr:JAB domain-containing protein [Pontiella desulfatans]VGO17709.1 hypothetical protein PDESU_06311 [Pontiella desulfatans]